MKDFYYPNEIGLFKVSLFDSCRDKNKYKDVSLINFIAGDLNKKFSSRVLELRNMNDSQQQKFYKSTKLCAATISCTFNQERNSNDIHNVNSIVCIDIDKQDNPETDFGRLKEQLFSLDYVYCVSKSCRGNGLFCIIPILDPGKFKAHYKHICDTLENQFKIKIDRACSDVTRLRFISYDDSILIKNNVKVNSYKDFDTSLIKNEQQLVKKYPNQFYNRTNIYFDVACMHYLIHQMNFHTDDEPSWFRTCVALTALDFPYLGEKSIGFSLFELISRRSDKYDERSVINKWNSCKSRYSNTSSMAYFYSILKHKLGPDWRKIISQYNNNEFRL